MTNNDRHMAVRHPGRLLIGGEWVGPATKKGFKMKKAMDGQFGPQAHHGAMVDTMANVFEASIVDDLFAPLAMSRHCETIKHYKAAGRRDGDRLAHSGRRLRHLNSGFVIEPTLFANVDSSSTNTQEGFREPVTCVSPAADEPQMVAMAHDMICGLNSSVVTHDGDHFERLAHSSRSATVQKGLRTDSAIGFGGFRQCGAGLDDNVKVLRFFLGTKTIVTDRLYVG